MCMRCRVTSRTVLALRSTTKANRVVEDLEAEEESEEMVEVEDQSLAITVDNKDTMLENVISPSQYVSIVNLMTILWKTTLFYRGSGGTRDRSKKI